MPHMLLIVEPLGQRAAHGLERGQAAYASMVAYGEALAQAGLLMSVNSLSSHQTRLSRANGASLMVDGPFAEAKEMVGGYFLLDTEDPAVALAWAERCPAVDWATVEIRSVGPCYT